MYSRRNSQAAERAAERRKREDEAPRLNAEVPRLESLRLEIEARRSGAAVGGTAHIRRIVVENAPALFLLPCSDRDCREGGHDLTREIMAQLTRGSAEFEGEHACDGQLGSVPCGSVIRYVAVATYRS